MSDGTNGAVASENYAIGISFGNSYSSIAHISAEGKIEVIANEEGDRQIPSILSYVDGEEYHGTQAKAQLVRNAKNSITYFKDYIGKAYSGIDPSPCKTSAHPTEANGKVVFTVQDKEEGEPSALTVSEVTTRHLRKLRDSAADFIGKKITAAVVTVPTDTTADQKAALAAAAKEADLEILTKAACLFRAFTTYAQPSLIGTDGPATSQYLGVLKRFANLAKGSVGVGGGAKGNTPGFVHLLITPAPPR